MRILAMMAALCLAACGGGGGQPAKPAPIIGAPQAPVVVPPQPPVGVILVGDEMMADWPAVAPDSYPAGAVNAGVRLATAQQLAASFQSTVLSRRPAVVVLSGGLHNIRHQEANGALDDYATTWTMADAAASSGACVVLVSLLPVDAPPEMFSRASLLAYNEGRQLWAQVYGWHYVDAFAALADPDGRLRAEYAADVFHLNAAGYAVLGQQVAAGIAACQGD